MFAVVPPWRRTSCYKAGAPRHASSFSATSATERPYDQYPSFERFRIGARIRRRRSGGFDRPARAEHAADQAAAGNRQEYAADRSSRNLRLRQGWPVLEVELAQDR